MDERLGRRGCENWAPGAGIDFIIIVPILKQMSQVCSALREELESQNQQRMDALNKKFIPLVVTDEPSRKANYKISAMRVLYELHSLKQRRAFMSLRAEIEEGNRVKVENEVGIMIMKVSYLGLMISI